METTVEASQSEGRCGVLYMTKQAPKVPGPSSVQWTSLPVLSTVHQVTLAAAWHSSCRPTYQIKEQPLMGLARGSLISPCASVLLPNNLDHDKMVAVDWFDGLRIH